MPHMDVGMLFSSIWCTANDTTWQSVCCCCHNETNQHATPRVEAITFDYASPMIFFFCFLVFISKARHPKLQHTWISTYIHAWSVVIYFEVCMQKLKMLQNG